MPCDGDFAVHSRPAKGLWAVFASNAVVKPATAALLCVSLGMLVAELECCHQFTWHSICAGAKELKRLPSHCRLHVFTT